MLIGIAVGAAQAMAHAFTVTVHLSPSALPKPKYVAESGGPFASLTIEHQTIVGLSLTSLCPPILASRSTSTTQTLQQASVPKLARHMIGRQR
jgi:hypothetical protein